MIEFFSRAPDVFCPRKHHPDLVFRQLSSTSPADELPLYGTKVKRFFSLFRSSGLKLTSGFCLLSSPEPRFSQNQTNKLEESGDENFHFSYAPACRIPAESKTAVENLVPVPSLKKERGLWWRLSWKMQIEQFEKQPAWSSKQLSSCQTHLED